MINIGNLFFGGGGGEKSFLGAQTPLFSISGDISSGFKNQSV